MSVFRPKGRPHYYVEHRWRGWPHLRLTTGTSNKAYAETLDRTVCALKAAGRRDLLGLLAAGRITVSELHEAYMQRGDELEQLKARGESPTLGPLVDRFLDWCRSPAGVSLRTKRRYAPRTIDRYAVSWAGFFAVLPRGRDATLADLTPGFFADYRRARVKAVGGRERLAKDGEAPAAGTINRDLAALGAFLTWLREVEGQAVPRLKIRREREPTGLERWLSADELRAFERACPPAWWAFFATLFYTGARLGEVRGLRGGDVVLHAKRIQIHEGHRRTKSRHAVRHVPIPSVLETALAAQLARVGPGPADVVFPDAQAATEAQAYKLVRRVWDRACTAAGIQGATPHTARHTFGVHAAQAGIPLVRLQQLMGHATPHMTLRYMKHSPEAYLAEDGAAIAAHMAGTTDAESAARAAAARAGMRPA